MVRLSLATLMVLLLACQVRGAEADFQQHIGPLLVRHCLACHNPGEHAGGLDLTTAASTLKGGESGEAAIIPGKPAESPIAQRIRAGEMPPEGHGKPVSADELKQLEAWLAAGAPWPADRVLSPFEFTTDTRAGRDWWSLQVPVVGSIPRVGQPEWVRTPIDAFVLKRLESSNLTPNPAADRATLVRRLTLDVWGLPPTPEQVARFVADPAPDAYEKLVDELLASPRYGERWGRHWLDIARFGESNGYETNTSRANAWPYRDWVIAAFNNDMPYPEFILRQLAGDQVGDDAATGFLVGGAHDIVASPDIELTLQQRANDLDDMVSTTSTAFLGLSAGCAKCHDHKFDPISQRDYYSLQAVFAGVQHGARELRLPDNDHRQQLLEQKRQELAQVDRQVQELVARHQPLARIDSADSDVQRAPVDPRYNVDRFAPVRARFVRFSISATTSVEPCIDELEIFTAEEQPRNLALASAGAKATASSVYADGSTSLHQLAHLNDGRFGNPRSWISAEPGSGWVRIELAEPATVDRVVWARDRDGAFRDRLPTKYRIEVSESGDDWRLVATGDDRKPFDNNSNSAPSAGHLAAGLPGDVAEQVARLQSQASELRAAIAALGPLQAYLGTFKQPEATHLLYRGEPLQKREQVAPAGITSVTPAWTLPADAPEAARRLALARWIGSPTNPLTARVMVNRIWHYHFGQGLMQMPSDFGFNGGLPSHAELLDYLAARFMAEGWRPKSIHRLILLSNTYRQSSQYREQAANFDGGSRLLWRFPPRRLEAEPIRDSMLAASGVLDLRMGGPGYDAFEPNTNYVKVYKARQTFGPAEWRRMVYQDKPRMRQDGTFGEFDCPDASQAVARRNISTTALQALNLLNGSFVMQQSALLAERLQRETPEVDVQIRQAFFWTFCRQPDESELAAARELIREHGLSVFCRALFNANEFLYLN